MPKHTRRSRPTKPPDPTPPHSTRRDQPIPSVIQPLAADFAAAKALGTSPEGRRYLQAGLYAFDRLLRHVAGKQWSEVPSSTVLAFALGGDATVAKAVVSFMGPGPSWVVDRALPYVLLAYLGRQARRRNLGWEALTKEMAAVCLHLCATEEFVRRMKAHPFAGLLWVIADSQHPEPPGLPRWARSERAYVGKKATTAWIDRVAGTLWPVDPKTKRANTDWVQGILGEPDARTAKDEAKGLLGRRLAEDLRRLSAQSPEQVALDAIEGRLDYHRKSARQAVLQGQRPLRKRHNELEQPERIPDPSAQHEAEEAATDPERVAARVIRTLQLSAKEAQVVRYITVAPPGLTHSEMAEGAGVSLSTVENTIRKLAGNRTQILRILSPQH